MKKLLFVGLALLSFNVFSQSYLVLHNGVTLTIDKSGFVYDFSHFVLPYRVTIQGGQFLVENEKLSTVDQFGFLYQKNFKVKSIRGNGLNYFITNNGQLVTIDEQGFYYTYDEDSKILKKVSSYGGNFFVARNEKKKKGLDLYTVNNKGNYFKVDVEGLDPADISEVGGKYFMANNILYTVSKEGIVFSKPETKIGKIVKKGGNYFITDDGKLYTVSDEGYLILPILPANIVVSNIENLGSNYMLDTEGRFFTVDNFGNMHEREIIGHDLTNTKVFSY